MLRTTILSFLLFLPLACSDGDSGSSGDKIQKGTETYTPTPDPDEPKEKGKPSQSTNISCSDEQKCDYWYCQCNDGAIVNSSYCKNQFCMNAEASCPQACNNFNHDGWSGNVGGGPKLPTDPVGPSCGQQGSSSDVCWSCLEESCCEVSGDCYSNGNCLEYWDCLLGCANSNEVDCAETCRINNETGAALLDSLEQCLAQNCSSAC